MTGYASGWQEQRKQTRQKIKWNKCKDTFWVPAFPFVCQSEHSPNRRMMFTKWWCLPFRRDFRMRTVICFGSTKCTRCGKPKPKESLFLSRNQSVSFPFVSFICLNALFANRRAREEEWKRTAILCISTRFLPTWSVWTVEPNALNSKSTCFVTSVRLCLLF